MTDNLKELRKFLYEETVKQKQPNKKSKSIDEKDKEIAREIGYILKGYASKIERMFPMPWELSSSLLLDKQTIEKRGSAHLSADLKANWGYSIAKDGTDTSSAYFIIEFYSYSGGEGVICGVSVSGFDPCCRDRELGVEMNPVPNNGEIDLSIEWKKNKKDFDATKDVLPMIMMIMKELKRLMPVYEEYYE